MDPILDDNGDLVVDIPEIANTWATYNHRQATPDSHEDYDNNFKEQVETVIKQIENRQSSPGHQRCLKFHSPMKNQLRQYRN